MQNIKNCFKCHQALVYDDNDALIIDKQRKLDLHLEEPLTSEVYVRLNDILKGHIEITHPLCQSCLDILHDQLAEELSKIEEDINVYTQALDLVTAFNTVNVNDNASSEIDKSKQKIKILGDEKELNKKLEALKNECQKLDEDYKIAFEESHQLALLEESLNQEYNQTIYENIQNSDQLMSAKNQLNYVEDQIEKWNKADPIKFDGPYGVINNFRLGRLPNTPNGPVSWNEINAAWGQALLLLNSLARKLKFQFDKYQLVPMGNHSYLRAYQERSHVDGNVQDGEGYRELPLYCSGGFRFFWDTKFDQAMVAFLDCVHQIVRELERKDAQFNLPYKMDKGRLVEPSSGMSYSIKAQFNSEENWTKALKFTLTNMQWIQTCICSQY